MEQKTNAFKPPLSLVVLDMIGAIFLGLGLAKMFAGADFLPYSLPFNEKGWTLIIIGAFLMLPMLWHLFAKIREQAELKITK